MSISEIIDRMAAIKQEKKVLESEYDRLQAQLQISAEAALTDTKIKSVHYAGTNGNTAIVTIADTISIVAGELLPAIVKAAFLRLSAAWIVMINQKKCSQRSLKALILIRIKIIL